MSAKKKKGIGAGRGGSRHSSLARTCSSTASREPATSAGRPAATRRSASAAAAAAGDAIMHETKK